MNIFRYAGQLETPAFYVDGQPAVDEMNLKAFVPLEITFDSVDNAEYYEVGTDAGMFRAEAGRPAYVSFPKANDGEICVKAYADGWIEGEKRIAVHPGLDAVDSAELTLTASGTELAPNVSVYFSVNSTDSCKTWMLRSSGIAEAGTMVARNGQSLYKASSWDEEDQVVAWVTDDQGRVSNRVTVDWSADNVPVVVPQATLDALTLDGETVTDGMTVSAGARYTVEFNPVTDAYCYALCVDGRECFYRNYYPDSYDYMIRFTKLAFPAGTHEIQIKAYDESAPEEEEPDSNNKLIAESDVFEIIVEEIEPELTLSVSKTTAELNEKIVFTNTNDIAVELWYIDENGIPRAIDYLSPQMKWDIYWDVPVRYQYFCNDDYGRMSAPITITYRDPNEFVVENGVLTAYTGFGGEVVIPNNLGITRIGENAFAGNSDITKIVLPSGLTDIDNNAFYECSGLTEITIPDSVTEIRNNAFEACDGLSSIVIPEGVISIGNEAFYNCENLKSVTLPSTLTSIGAAAFRYCENLTEIAIPEGVTSIGNQAFYECRSLTEITIPEGVTSIGNYAFRDCRRLTNITIPESVTSIGVWAFYNCNLQKVMFLNPSESLPEIASQAFDKTTFHCYKSSAADTWIGANYPDSTVIYLDDMDLTQAISLNLPDRVILAPDAVRTVSVDAFPLSCAPYLTWTSSAPEIVSVDNGVLTAHAVGTATVSVSSGEVSDSMNVICRVPATDFAFTEPEYYAAPFETLQIGVVIQPAGTGAEFKWDSGDYDVMLSNDGEVMGWDVGDVVITATMDGRISHSCVVHICEPVTAVEFTEAEAEVAPGSRKQLIANVTSGTLNLVNKLVSFTSSDETVAAVDRNGLVTAVGGGTATITAEASSGISDTCQIRVASIPVTTLPAGTKEIQDEAFMNSSVERVVIPDGCKKIGSKAFASCDSLKVVEIPASVTDIAADAFAGSSDVVIVTASGSPAEAYAVQHRISYTIIS